MCRFFLCCCWYHKGTNFQANHNYILHREFNTMLLLIPQRYEFSSKSQQYKASISPAIRCCWYHKGTNFQANHNKLAPVILTLTVVADTTKVRIFKQITTESEEPATIYALLLIPQRYEFSSKSQRMCAIYPNSGVVADTTKVRIFKQITTIPAFKLF